MSQEHEVAQENDYLKNSEFRRNVVETPKISGPQTEQETIINIIIDAAKILHCRGIGWLQSNDTSGIVYFLNRQDAVIDQGALQDSLDEHASISRKKLKLLQLEMEEGELFDNALEHYERIIPLNGQVMDGVDLSLADASNLLFFDELTTAPYYFEFSE